MVQRSKNRWREPAEARGGSQGPSRHCAWGWGLLISLGCRETGTSHPSTENGLAGRRPEEEVYALRGVGGIFPAFSFSLFFPSIPLLFEELLLTPFFGVNMRCIS